MVPMPRDSEEKEILEKLTNIRDRLLLLKQDRANYIRSQDVLVLYNETIEQVRRLNEFRKGKDKTENRGESTDHPAAAESPILTVSPQWIRFSKAASSSSRCSS